MKLTYYKSTPSNFGDEVNASMWAQLLPEGFLDEDETELFVGIGSIINTEYPKSARKFVAGSGFAGYTPRPDVTDGSWEFLWVRGPQTAAMLGLDPNLAITDSAVLLRSTVLPAPASNVGIAFMPHFHTFGRGNWEEVCALAGVTFLDPRAPVQDLLSKIRGARIVITEAMHGAIIADALRRPWIGVLPFHHKHRGKWNDWALSLQIDLKPLRLSPSTLAEAWADRTGFDAKGARSRMVLSGVLASAANTAMKHRAARHLQDLADGALAQMSQDAAIERQTDRALTALNRFVHARKPAARGTDGMVLCH